LQHFHCVLTRIGLSGKIRADDVVTTRHIEAVGIETRYLPVFCHVLVTGGVKIDFVTIFVVEVINRVLFGNRDCADALRRVYEVVIGQIKCLAEAAIQAGRLNGKSEKGKISQVDI